jgi:hypothetical protein
MAALPCQTIAFEYHRQAPTSWIAGKWRTPHWGLCDSARAAKTSRATVMRAGSNVGFSARFVEILVAPARAPPHWPNLYCGNPVRSGVRPPHKPPGAVQPASPSPLAA